MACVDSGLQVRVVPNDEHQARRLRLLGEPQKQPTMRQTAEAATQVAPKPQIEPVATPKRIRRYRYPVAFMHEPPGVMPMGFRVVPPIDRTVDRILNAVEDRYEFSRSELLSHRKQKALANARHVAMYLICEMTDYSMPAVGRVFNGRDHTTILHARKKIALLVSADSKVATEVAEIKAQACGY